LLIDMAYETTNNYEIINGVPTDSLQLRFAPDEGPYASSALHNIYFIIAGNPGVLQFYEKFCHSYLAAVVRSDPLNFHSIYCCSHANHHTKSVFKSSTDIQCFGLAHQVLHHTVYMEQTVSYYQSLTSIDYTRTRVHLLGHSIGAYIAMESINTSKILQPLVVSLALLMPFFRWRNLSIEHKRNLLLIKKTIPIVTLLAKTSSAAMNVLPTQLREFIVRQTLSKSHSSYSTLISNEICNNQRLAANFCSMGVDEVIAIENNVDSMEKLLDIARRLVVVTVVHTNDDDWAPEADFDDIKSRARGAGLCGTLRSYFERDLSHSFVMSEVSTSRVVSLLIDDLKPLPRL
jgi:Lipid-droplet associated hydrolase